VASVGEQFATVFRVIAGVYVSPNADAPLSVESFFALSLEPSQAKEFFSMHDGYIRNGLFEFWVGLHPAALNEETFFASWCKKTLLQFGWCQGQQAVNLHETRRQLSIEDHWYGGKICES
jgi:hypothetical protein